VSLSGFFVKATKFSNEFASGKTELDLPDLETLATKQKQSRSS
jgi:hypothetical protein